MSTELSELRRRPLVFVDDLSTPELTADDRSHLERSLRLRAGDSLSVSDGNGSWRPVAFGDQLICSDDVVRHEARLAPSLAIAFALVKGDRTDLVIQKLTELGVDTLAPVTTGRSVVTWKAERVAKNWDRHRRIAREAAMQSRRVYLPEVLPCQPLAEFLQRFPEAVLGEPGGAALSDNDTSIVIGPEGGFTAEELDGRRTVGLPGRILRTETAAIAAGTLAAHIRPG